MPVKRRIEKRRVDPRAEADAWRCMFDCGHDFFDDLRDIGVTSHHDPHPPQALAEKQRAELREATEAAWHRLGDLWLRSNPPAAGKTPWALQTFGEPNAG